MRVREVMRAVRPLDGYARFADVVEAIEQTGCEALPIVENGGGEQVVRQLVFVRDLPKLRLFEDSAERGHVVGEGVIDLLAAMGRKPSRFPTIGPEATLADAWGMMADENAAHLPVVEDGHVVGMVSLVVSFAEFPHRSPGAGFW
jgi:CBS domain-containing protein